MDRDIIKELKQSVIIIVGIIIIGLFIANYFDCAKKKPIVENINDSNSFKELKFDEKNPNFKNLKQPIAKKNRYGIIAYALQIYVGLIIIYAIYILIKHYTKNNIASKEDNEMGPQLKSVYNRLDENEMLSKSEIYSAILDIQYLLESKSNLKLTTLLSDAQKCNILDKLIIAEQKLSNAINKVKND